jgi:hypothetical protein
MGSFLVVGLIAAEADERCTGFRSLRLFVVVPGRASIMRMMAVRNRLLVH